MVVLAEGVRSHANIAAASVSMWPASEISAREPAMIPTITSVKGAAMIRVLVVDDDAVVRALLARVLNRADGIGIVGECGDGAEVPDLADSTRPDVVLMDVHMPGTSGIDATHDLLVSRPSTRVILLTASTSSSTVAAAAQAGAAGFLVKGSAHERLISAVRTVAAGGTAWPSDPPADAGAAPRK